LGAGLAIESPHVIVHNPRRFIVLVHMEFRATNEHAAALRVQWQIERDPASVSVR
jgi:hypothetical protein